VGLEVIALPGRAAGARVATPGRGHTIVARTPGAHAGHRPPGATRALAREDAEYPEALLELAHPPARLFVRGGELPARADAVAIVGTRTATPYGLRIAGRLAFDLASRGVTVVSGLARGIDAGAHEGSLAAGGRTVAVIPSALDRVTPPAHAALAERIAGSGALMSEVEHGGPFGRGAFVQRNRLIAALAQVTVVVEAGEESGALATAAAARTLGRVVLAVPADVDRPGAQGTLALLRAGAQPCADAGDVLRALGPRTREASDPDALLLASLGREPRDVETIARACGAGAGETLARLLRLQWSGLAVGLPGGRWTSAH
jgi:DNA processing protein